MAHIRISILFLAPLLTLALAGPAQAVVSVDGSSFINAGSGSFTVAGDGAGHYRFTAPGIFNASSACTQGSGVVTCPADGLLTILAAGSGGADTIIADVDVAPAMIAVGHDGKDTLTTGPGPDHLSGGSGNDTLNGGDGDDHVTDQEGFSGVSGGGTDVLRGADGADTIDAGVLGAGVAGATSGGGNDLLDGGPALDTVDYGARTAPVMVTVDSPGVLGTSGNDGEAGENDNVINAEHVVGGSAGDTITASNIVSRLDGGPGADTLRGGDAPDTVDPGVGTDVVEGNGGADTVLAQDGELDTVACGPGTDAVQADAFDVIAADCENVTRTAAVPGSSQTVTVVETVTQTVTTNVPPPLAPPPPGPVLALPKTLKADGRGRVTVAVGCPRSAVPGCLFGTATLTTAPKKGAGKRLGTDTFTTRAGKTAKVRITLSAAGRRSLAKARKLTAVLTATAMNGEAQTKTTTARVTVRR